MVTETELLCMIKYNEDILSIFRKKVNRYVKYYYEANKEILLTIYWSIPKSTSEFNKQECQNRYNKEWAKLKPEALWF